MSESKLISVPNDIPLGARIEEVHRQISKWIQSLDKPFRPSKDILRLVKCGRKGLDYKYRYKIERDVVTSGRPWATEK